ncbi:P-loop containing nucleoside triphosphate hydrolase protein [Mycena albidolilacea]|uniref:P-loop containing nucleoside triphosphate hydrolase protein n=1 Tax=Mycena albidolilacea TaxID=1033008 RepID=A0AAD6YXD8_9AGAR|nr:P-loop containing nucleoside triphosphate hydrolase protein [Mycena albidolilacea]
MLPSEPKIFHGRESEISDILALFDMGTPRIAILGGGGMGKTSLARALLHHPKIIMTYGQNRFFVSCNSVSTEPELVALIGAHLGLKQGIDLTRPVLRHFSNSPPSLLILDELETLWEQVESHSEIEELLALLTSVDHLALIITMRGAERPAKVRWTRPFLTSLQPLNQEAARLTFTDIADSGHSLEAVNRILSLADNMPLAISLLAHLADSEGCEHVLSRWDKEKTSLISDGFDKRSNLDISISLSLSSPRIQLLPHSQELLSVLSMLPDGLLNSDLLQSKLPLKDILKCKTALKSTALAFSDENQRLRALMPIREYMQQYHPPRDDLVRSLLKYFQQLLEFYVEFIGTESNLNTIPQIVPHIGNIHHVLQWGIQQRHSDLVNSIYCVCYLNQFSKANMQGCAPLITQIYNILPQLTDHRLKAYFIKELLGSCRYYQTSNPETLISQGLKHFEHFDDSDLLCMLCILYSLVETDI